MKFLRFLSELNKRLVKNLILLDDVPSQYRPGGDHYASDEIDSSLGDNAELNVIAHKNEKIHPSKSSRKI